MFNLDKRERLIAAFLSLTFVIGAFLIFYIKSNRSPGIQIKRAIFSNTRPSHDNKILNIRRGIDINRSSIEQLTALDGVGDALARRIVQYRSDNGPFRDVEEIKNVKGIGDALFMKIKDEISVE